MWKHDTVKEIAFTVCSFQSFHMIDQSKESKYFLLGDPRSEPLMQCVLCLEWINIEEKVYTLKDNLKKLLFFSLMPCYLTSVFLF